MRAKIIEKLDLNYAFLVIFVKKNKKNKKDKEKERKYKIMIDYRLLNEDLQTYSNPIPNIKDILYSISGKRYYTVLDLHRDFF